MKSFFATFAVKTRAGYPDLPGADGAVTRFTAECTKNTKNRNGFTAEAPRRGGRSRASNIQLNFGSCDWGMAHDQCPGIPKERGIYGMLRSAKP